MLDILRTEYIKLKGSHFISIMLIVTLAPLLNGISVASKLRTVDPNVNSIEAIYDFSIHAYTMVILPTIIILIFASSMREERLSGGIKELLTLPVTKKQVYFSKLIVGIALTALSLCAFLVVLLGAGIFQKTIVVKSAFLITSRIIKIFFTSLGIIAIQFYLSINYESVTVPLGIGFCFLIPSFLLGNSKYSIAYPWAYITAINNSVSMDLRNALMISISLVIFLTISILGYIRFNKADVC